LIVQGGGKDLPSKFDLLLRRFLADQLVKHKTFNFDVQTHASIFEQFKPEVK